MPLSSQKGFQEIDFKAGVNAGMAALVYMLLYHLFPNVDQYLNICVMGIAAVFITEMDWKKIGSAGLSRCVIMGIGTAVGFLVIFLDGIIQNDIAVCALFGIAVVCMLVLEKATGKMYIQCKLGSVALTLTVFTFRETFYAQIGKTCYGYGIMFFLSTAVTVPICVAIMFIWDSVRNVTRKKLKKG